MNVSYYILIHTYLNSYIINIAVYSLIVLETEYGENLQKTFNANSSKHVLRSRFHPFDNCKGLMCIFFYFNQQYVHIF